MSKGGQLTPPSYFTAQNAAILLGVLVALWVVVKAFTPCPPPIVREKMSNKCPCANKTKTWNPFA